MFGGGSPSRTWFSPGRVTLFLRLPDLRLPGPALEHVLVPRAALPLHDINDYRFAGRAGWPSNLCRLRWDELVALVR